jgi:hypothetical protein
VSRPNGGPLTWPIAGPSYPGLRDGELVTVSPGTRWLSAEQRSLLWLVEHRIGRQVEWTTTLAALSESLGGRSRGATWRQLARLRQLGRIAFRGERGRHGRLILWIPPAALAARRHGFRYPRRGNDSPSRLPRFVSAQGVRRAWGQAEGGGPPGAGATASDRLAYDAGARPPSGVRRPPRYLTARCPAGHRNTVGQRSWRRTIGTVSAEWRGSCRRCRRPVSESIVLRLTLPPHPPLPASIRDDPGRLDRLRAMAAAFDADGLAVPAAVRRQYLDA